MNALTVIEPASNVDLYRTSTDAAELCREIVIASASKIQGRQYVCVEGWQAIAVAHGCTASARSVERVEGGVRAVGEIRRMSDGVVIAQAEGFVGEDEPTWYGGKDARGKTHPRRADYAIRAMAQTRAISRACRSAFAHVVVMMKAGLSTTPAEEVPLGGFDDAPVEQAPRQDPVKPATITDAQRDEIASLAQAKGIDLNKVCRLGNIRDLREMTVATFPEAKAWLERQKPRPATSDAPKPTFGAGELLDDEIPY